jgi:Glycosyl hydrolase catalytic core
MTVRSRCALLGGRQESPRSRSGSLALCAGIICAGASVTAPSAASAADPVYGVVPQDGALPPRSELHLMRDGGVESIRLMAHWGTVEPAPGVRNWRTLDALVRETTERGIQPLLFLYGPAQWVVKRDGRKCAEAACAVIAPSSKSTRKAYARFAKAAVKRYGPGGDFWKPPDLPVARAGDAPDASTSQDGSVTVPCEPIELPGCTPTEPPPPGDDGTTPSPTPPPPPPPEDPSDPDPLPTDPPCGCTVAQPVRVWQIWNEQNSPKYYAPKVRVKGYARLVKATGKAIKSVDPKAEVMLGGMWGPESLKRGKKKPPVTTYVDYMKRLYKVRGIKKRFDSLAIHPYSSNVSGMLAQMREARRVARAFGDRKVGLWITEIGWASGGPKREPYNKGDDGQAKQLKKAYRKLERKRRAFRLRGVFWYSWRDRPGGEEICAWCGHAGLLNLDGSPKPAWDAFVRMASG